MTPGRRAYVFYATNDVYAVAVLVFVHRLRRLGMPEGTPVVVLHLSLSEPLLTRLRSLQIVTRRVPSGRLLGVPYCRDCLVKLRLFDLTDYEQIVYVDADSIPLQRLDDLLELSVAEPIAAPRAYWMPQPWWGSHLLVVRPSAELWTRVARHFATASERQLHDMDLLNLEFAHEIHSLPAETACLNSEWEDAGRPGAFGDPAESYARTAVVHFTALGKPWTHTPEEVRRLRPNAHPQFHRLWEMWWEARAEVFQDEGSPAGWSGSELNAAAAPAPPAGAPVTLHRAQDFHLWFARAFQHRLGPRYSTFLHALLLALARGATTLVETGTARERSNWTYDGQSTLVLGAFAQRYGCTLWTCDSMEPHIQVAQELTAPFGPQIRYVVSDSVDFLRRFPKPIDLLYLDSVDFDVDAPELAQDHALREGQAALHALHENSLVLIDDCDLPHGGKGARLIRFLEERGWRVVGRKYQMLLSRTGVSQP